MTEPFEVKLAREFWTDHRPETFASLIRDLCNSYGRPDYETDTIIQDVMATLEERNKS